MQSNQFASAFSPIVPTASVAAVSGSSTEADINADGNTMQIFNDSTTAAFCNWSTTDGSSAAVTDYPVAPGAVVVVDVAPGTVSVSARRASGTGTVYFTKGFGL